MVEQIDKRGIEVLVLTIEHPDVFFALFCFRHRTPGLPVFRVRDDLLLLKLGTMSHCRQLQLHSTYPRLRDTQIDTGLTVVVRYLVMYYAVRDDHRRALCAIRIRGFYEFLIVVLPRTVGLGTVAVIKPDHGGITSMEGTSLHEFLGQVSILGKLIVDNVLGSHCERSRTSGLGEQGNAGVAIVSDPSYNRRF